MGRSYFHLHLVSDSTGETLIAASRAAAAQYQGVASIEHVYPLVRTPRPTRPGRRRNRQRAGHRALHPGRPRPFAPPRGGLRGLRFAVPLGARSDADPVPILSRAELDAARRRPAHAQSRVFQADRRAELHHDVRRRPVARRRWKAPISCCSASAARRRRRRASISPIAATRPPTSRWCPTCRRPRALDHLRRPLIVGLVASPDRIVQIRQNRLLALQRRSETEYVDRIAVAQEVTDSRRLFAERNWPIDRRHPPLDRRNRGGDSRSLSRARLKFIAHG